MSNTNTNRPVASSNKNTITAKGKSANTAQLPPATVETTEAQGLRFHLVKFLPVNRIKAKGSNNALSDYQAELARALKDARAHQKQLKLNGTESDTNALYKPLVAFADGMVTKQTATLPTNTLLTSDSPIIVNVTGILGDTLISAMNELADGKQGKDRHALTDKGAQRWNKRTSEIIKVQTEDNSTYNIGVTRTGYDNGGAMAKFLDAIEAITSKVMDFNYTGAEAMVESELTFYKGLEGFTKEYLYKLVQVCVYGRQIKQIQRLQANAVMDYDKASAGKPTNKPSSKRK